MKIWHNPLFQYYARTSNMVEPPINVGISFRGTFVLVDPNREFSHIVNIIWRRMKQNQ